MDFSSTALSPPPVRAPIVETLHVVAKLLPGKGCVVPDDAELFLWPALAFNLCALEIWPLEGTRHSISRVGFALSFFPNMSRPHIDRGRILPHASSATSAS